jgi:uncharacterized protein YjbI with pentapeptide repeats
MTLSGLQDRVAAIDALLYVARREMLLLAIAIGAIDDDGAAVAAARLRWAIGSARQLLATFDEDIVQAHRARQLDRIANRAQRWLVGEPPRSLQEIGGLIDRIAARRRPHAVGIEAAHASLVDLDLDELDLGKIGLQGAILTDVAARRAVCDAADLRAARWLRGELEGSSFAMAVFAGASVEHCDLSRANLEAASWHRATVVHSALRRALLIDARLDRAVFRDCNLRGADLAIVGSPHVASLAGARFERCDLRDTHWAGRELGGATLIDCKLFGAHGAPELAGVVIERADLSPAGDGSQLGAQRDVVAGWSTTAHRCAL